MGKPNWQAMFKTHLPSVQLVIMGIIQIVAGVLAIIFNIYSIEVSAELSFVGIGFWGGILYIVAGVIGIITSKIKALGMVICCAVLATVAGVVAFLMLVLCSIGFFADSLSDSKQSQVASNVILAIVALVELFGAIWQSCLCYLVLCCLHPIQQESSIHHRSPSKPQKAANYQREATRASVSTERETDSRSKSVDSQTHMLPGKTDKDTRTDTNTNAAKKRSSPTDRQSPLEFIGMENRRPPTAKPGTNEQQDNNSQNKKSVEAVDEEPMTPSTPAVAEEASTPLPTQAAPSVPPTPSPTKSTRRDSATPSGKTRRNSSASPSKSKTPVSPSPSPSPARSAKRDSSTGPSVARHT